jgi:hypothetical protein
MRRAPRCGFRFQRPLAGWERRFGPARFRSAESCFGTATLRLAGSIQRQDGPQVEGRWGRAPCGFVPGWIRRDRAAARLQWRPRIGPWRILPCLSGNWSGRCHATTVWQSKWTRYYGSWWSGSVERHLLSPKGRRPSQTVPGRHNLRSIAPECPARGRPPYGPASSD